MKKFVFNSALALAVCFGFGCENKRDNPNYSTTTDSTGPTENGDTTEDVGMQTPADSTRIVTGKPPVDVHASDGEFVMKTLSANKLEVQLGKIAAKKGTTAEVKNYGQHLVDDHAKAFTELISMAEKKKWEVPQKMIAEHQATFDKISKLSGKDFDKEFMAEMVKDHEKDIAEFEQTTQKATDADLKSFASKTLPTLRMHLDMARDINTKVTEKP
jgi:putative membrane protein